jgi:hypothetical protein
MIVQLRVSRIAAIRDGRFDTVQRGSDDSFPRLLCAVDQKLDRLAETLDVIRRPPR